MNLHLSDQEIRRNVHLIIVVVYTIMTAALLAVTLFWQWELFYVPILLILCALIWWLHIKQAMPEGTRVILYAASMMLGIFFYGIHENTFYDVAILIILNLLIFTMSYQSRAIHLIFWSYVVFLVYSLIAHLLRGDHILNFSWSRLIVQFGVVLLAYRIAMLVIRKHEDERQVYNRMIQDLSDVNRRTDDFMTNVSHELRTPINAVTGITNVMLQSESDEEKRRDLLSIQKAGNRLMGQIGDILDYTELDTGKLIISREEYQLSSIVNDLVTEISMMNRNNRLEIIFDLDPKVPSYLMGDGRRIKRILRHLLDNSLKFTHEGGIYVRIESVPKEYGVNLNLTVEDTGIGIPEENLKQILGGFYQHDSSRTRRVGGIGLGLPIVYGFVKALGGFLQIERKERGTLVSVSIPQQVEENTPSLHVDERDEICIACYIKSEKYKVPEVREYYDRFIEHLAVGLDLVTHRTNTFEGLKQLISTYRITHVFTAREEFEEHPSYFENLDPEIRIIVVADQSMQLPNQKRLLLSGKPISSLAVGTILNAREGWDTDLLYIDGRRIIFPNIRVLVVDDEDMNLFVANGIFRSYLMDVTTAMSGMEAIRLSEQAEFDLIFLDHMMPELDGIETLKLLKKAFSDRKMPSFVALTANAVSGAREMFLNEGFDEFVAKPVENLELERVLKKLLPAHCMRYAVPKLDEEAFMEAAKEQMEGAQVDPVMLLAAQGLNTTAGIDYCRGDRAFYMDLLRKFTSGAEKKSVEIRDDYEAEDWEGYRIRVHALKSSSRMIGADELSSLAHTLEDAARDENVTLIKDHNEQLLKAYLETGAMIKEALQPSAGESVKQEGERFISEDDLIVGLRETLACLETFEGERAEQILNSLFRFSFNGTPVSEILSEAQELIEDFDMEAASTIISDVLDTLKGGAA